MFKLTIILFKQYIMIEVIKGKNRASYHSTMYNVCLSFLFLQNSYFGVCDPEKWTARFSDKEKASRNAIHNTQSEP